MSSKTLTTITKTFLLAVTAIVPFVLTTSLYFPYVSGKAYVFRTLVVLAFFFWVWTIVENQKSKIKNQNYFPDFKNILVIALILFFGAQVLVSFFSVDPFVSFFSTIERAEGVLQYGFWLLYFLMLISLFQNEQDWKLFFATFISVALLLSIYSLFHLKEQQRIFGLFGNPSYFAAFLLFAIGFSAILIERKIFKEKLINYLLAAFILFFIAILILTQTRGAYLGLAGGIFLFCLLTILFLRKEKKNLAIFSGITLLLGLAFIVFLFSARETDFVKNNYLLKRTASATYFLKEDVFRERVLTWQIALKAFREKPFFGWGLEKFDSPFNKYYDYRIGKQEPWFDRTHNMPLEILSTGGIILFAFYIFWLLSAVSLILKIGRQAKLLSFILGSIFLAYFLQGLFLFDLLPIYLGLFPFLAYLVFVSQKALIAADKLPTTADKKIGGNQPLLAKISALALVLAAFLSLFIIYSTVILPLKANAAALKANAYFKYKNFQKVKPFLEKAYSVRSPYTFWDTRKRTIWNFIETLEYEINDKTRPQDINTLSELYDFLSPEVEKLVENKKYDPQIYYIAGSFYRLGYEKLGKNDLTKAEEVLRKSFNYSERRIEYFNELVKILIYEKKFNEADNLVKEHLKKIAVEDYISYLISGHLYFVAEKYEQAMEYYEKARELGYKFYENERDYARYMLTAENLKEYQKIVDMALARLKTYGPDADTFYNIAVGYLNLGEKEKAKEFFLKALELDNQYEKYRSFFEK